MLGRVLDEGAFLAPTLDAELGRAALPPADARLATELAYGVVRTLGWLEERIAAHATSRAWKKRPEVRAALLIGCYTLAFLERVPDFAAVNEAVRAVERAAGPRVAGFANAVLRRLAAERASAVDLATAAELALGPFLREALTRSGTPPRELLLAHETPSLCLCLRAGESREAWLEELRRARPPEDGATFEPGGLSPRAIVARRAGQPRALPGADRAWIVQEEGAQLIALALGARPGDVVLDACAGRGQKALLLAEEVAPDGRVDVADRHPKKLEELRGRTDRATLGASHAVDWTVGTGAVPDGYARALVDAPCSGTGTLRRRPEIALRLGPDDVRALAAQALAITRRVATRVKDGGRLVYAVCSVLREECEDVVTALLADAAPGVRLEPAPFDAAAARALAGDEPTLRLTPARHGTDGYFLASFVVRRAPAGG